MTEQPPGPPTEQAAHVLAERYGRRASWTRRRRAALALVGVAVLVGVTAAFFAWSHSRASTVRATVVGYSALSDSQIRVDYVVDKPEGTAVTCRIVAHNSAADVVGILDVALPAAGSSVQRSQVLPTRGRAVVAGIDSCIASPR